MMSTLTIENVPPELQFRLTQEATRYQRSLAQQALVLLELCLMGKTTELSRWPTDVTKQWLTPIQPALPISSDSVIELLRQARDEVDISVSESYNQRGIL